MNPSNSLTIYGLLIGIGIAPTLTGTPLEVGVLNPHNMNSIGVYRCSSVVELPFLGCVVILSKPRPDNRQTDRRRNPSRVAVNTLHLLAHGVAVVEGLGFRVYGLGSRDYGNGEWGMRSAEWGLGIGD